MESLGNMQNIGLRSFHTIYTIQGKSPKPFSGITAEKLQLFWFIGINTEIGRDQDRISGARIWVC